MKLHLLEVDSVLKHYHQKLIISDAYLRCETGQIIGFLGRNGSGKSTLLKIIFGIVTADFKFIRIDGLVKNTTSDLLKEISYLSQENFIPKHFNVKKVVFLSVEKSNHNSFFEDEMIKQITNKKIHELSGGELRYLEIKIILENNSKFVLLDEPYNGLSPIMIEKINKLIIENSNKKGIIISDHNYENVIAVSTNLLLMKDGKLFHLKDKYELIEEGYLNQGAF